jgi:hypothetical protein
MTEITHTIDESTDERFKTAGDCVVSIQSSDGQTLSVNLIPKDGRESEVWDWDNETVVEHLINGNLIPKDSKPTDYLEA